MYACTYVCRYVRMYVCMYVSVHVYTHVYKYRFLHVLSIMHVFVCVCVQVCLCMHVQVCIYTCNYRCVCIHRCMVALLQASGPQQIFIITLFLLLIFLSRAVCKAFDEAARGDGLQSWQNRPLELIEASSEECNLAILVTAADAF